MDTPQPAPATRGAIASVVAQIQAERRWFTLMRLSFSGVCLSWLLLLTWPFPWAPIGMMIPDYSAAMAVGLIFGLAAVCSSLAFMVVWRPAFRHESLQEFVRVLFGAGQLIRGRGQFRSRLATECCRAKRDNGNVFSLIVIQLAKAQVDSQKRPQRRFERNLTAIFVRSIARADDIVADCWPDEVWLLALGADDEARQNIVRRMTRILAEPGTSLPLFVDARSGSSTFGPDGKKPGDIFAAAYERLLPLADPTGKPLAA